MPKVTDRALVPVRVHDLDRDLDHVRVQDPNLNPNRHDRPAVVPRVAVRDRPVQRPHAVLLRRLQLNKPNRESTFENTISGRVLPSQQI